MPINFNFGNKDNNPNIADIAALFLAPPVGGMLLGQKRKAREEDAWKKRYEFQKSIEDELTKRKEKEKRGAIKQIADAIQATETMGRPDFNYPAGAGPREGNVNYDQPMLDPTQAIMKILGQADAAPEAANFATNILSKKMAGPEQVPVTYKETDKGIVALPTKISKEGIGKLVGLAPEKAANQVKGTKVTVMKDGKPTQVLVNPTTGEEMAVLGEAPPKSLKVEMGGMSVDESGNLRIGASKTVQDKLVKDAIDAENQLRDFDRVMDLWKPEFSTTTFQLGSKVRSWGRRSGFDSAKDIAKWATMAPRDIDDKEKQFIGWSSKTSMMALIMRKFITGVAGGKEEMEAIMSNLPNVTDDPLKYWSKLMEWQTGVQQTRDALNEYIAQGVKLGKHYESWADIPKDIRKDIATSSFAQARIKMRDYTPEEYAKEHLKDKYGLE